MQTQPVLKSLAGQLFEVLVIVCAVADTDSVEVAIWTTLHIMAVMRSLGGQPYEVLFIFCVVADPACIDVANWTT